MSWYVGICVLVWALVCRYGYRSGAFECRRVCSQVVIIVMLVTLVVGVCKLVVHVVCVSCECSVSVFCGCIGGV